MKQFAYVNGNGEVIHVVSPGNDNDYYDGQIIDDCTVYEISSNEDQVNFIRTRYRKNDEWRVRSPKPGEYYYWDMQNEIWQYSSEALYSLIRQQRDIKLYQCDWTQLTDAPLNENKKQEWTIYRQELRDLPQNQPSLTSLEEVVWPTPPTN
jgi:hypothetical protein